MNEMGRESGEEFERISRVVFRMDATFAIITATVFACLTALTILAMIGSGPAGLVFMIIVWLFAIPAWSKLVRLWLDERSKLVQESLSKSRERDIVEELTKLRESIEALRKSLEE